jgi:hypothetical protein
VGVKINDRGWPVVRVDYAGPLLMADHESLAAAMDGYLGRRQRFAVVFGSRPAGRGERGTAKAQFGWLRAEHDRLARWCAGWVMLVDPVEQGSAERAGTAAAQAVMPFPRHLASTLDEALNWVAERLGEGQSGEGQSGEGQSGEGRSGEGRSGEGESGEGESGEGLGGAGHGRAECGR